MASKAERRAFLGAPGPAVVAALVAAWLSQAGCWSARQADVHLCNPAFAGEHKGLRDALVEICS